MFWLITGIIVAIALFIGLGFIVEKTTLEKWNGEQYVDERVIWKLNKKQFFTVFGLIFCFFGFIAKVPANSVGIVYSPFRGTSEKTLSEGFNSKGMLDKVYKISTEVQTEVVEGLTTQTKDAQYVISDLDIKYRVAEDDAYLVFTQYRTLEKMSKSLIVPTTQRILELITTEYNVIDILGEKRSEIYTRFEEALRAELAVYGVEFYSVTINDMDAGEQLEAAIAAEAVAKKEVETAEQNLLKAETEAKQQSVEAQAAQDAAKIKAETKIINAEATRESNRIVAESLTSDILEKMWIEKWDGKMPTYYSGSEDGMNVILDAGSNE